MLIFLYGQDTYRLQQKLKEIEERYKKIHKGALNLEKLDAGISDFKGFWDAFSQQSMFIKKKLFFLENIFSNEQFKKNLLKSINDISKSQNIVVLIEKKEIPKTDNLFQALKKQAKSQHFQILTGQKLRNWIKQEFTKYNSAVEEPALSKLIDYVGSDLWRLSQEIKKLSAYKAGVPEIVILSISEESLNSKKSPNLITVKDVNLFIKPKLSAEIFKTIDELARGNKKTALQMLEDHLTKGDSPFYLLKMFAWQFRNLLLVKSAAFPSAPKLGMKPFVFRKNLALSAKFSLEQLKKIYQKIFEADLNIKTGKIAPEEGLRMLIATI